MNKYDITGRRWKVGTKVKWKENVGMFDFVWVEGTIIEEQITSKYPRGREWRYYIRQENQVFGDFVLGKDLRIVPKHKK